MPYAKAFRDDRNLQRPKRADLCVAAFEHPHLMDMAAVFPATHDQGGYPDLLLFAVASGVRAWSSINDGLRHLSDEKQWRKATAAYTRATGNPGPFPRHAPTARMLEVFYRRATKDANTWHRVSMAFMDASIAFAKSLGQFTPGVQPDFTKTDHRHIVTGDGTYVAPWSNAQYVTDPITGDPIVIGSRSATGNPRIQTTRTDPTFDEKHAVGINHVTLSTWTEAGWVILGVDQAMGAEKDAATRLLTQFSKRVGDGLHVIVWDRVLTGSLIGWALNELRALVINKSVARERLDSDKGKKKKRKGATKARKTATTTRAPRARVRRPRTSPFVKITKVEAVTAFTSGQPLPLGTSVYETTTGHEMVRGVVHHYGPPSAEIACAHDLWVDDGALVDVVRDAASGWQMKVAVAVAETSLPEATSDGHRLVTTWHLPCHAGQTATEHTFTTVWDPAHESNSQTQKALAAMRPIARIDDRFRNTHGLRNITESINMWIKSRLSHTRRAGHLLVEDQAFDHLLLGHLANSGTARRARLLGLLP